jgi:hypothetical protein
MWETPQSYEKRYSGQMRLNVSFLAIKENAISAETQHLSSPREHHCEAWWWQHHAVGMFFPSAGTGKLVRIEGMMDGA